MLIGVNRFASLLLGPFWLIGRTLSLLATAGRYLWDSFLDGIGGDPTDRDLDVLIVGWLIVLTVLVLL